MTLPSVLNISEMLTSSTVQKNIQNKINPKGSSFVCHKKIMKLMQIYKSALYLL